MYHRTSSCIDLGLFQLPRKLDQVLGTEENPYDATKSGPLCSQLGLDAETIDHYLVM